tara:strand:- start:2591 stop:3100 length:510 start_codon:yes stop_codon:yes gene_type:complete
MLTDEQIDQLLASSNKDFYNTVDFTNVNFNDWIVEKGFKSRRPTFRRGKSYRNTNCLASIVNEYFKNTIDEILNYPISFSEKGIGVLTIKELDIFNGRERTIVNPDGSHKKVIDDYFIKYPRFRIFYNRASFGVLTPYLVSHNGLWLYHTILRKVAIRYPKGKFYNFVK